MSLVENIKSLCAKSGTSVPKLEKELGFGKGAIYNWDKNSPSLDKLKKVAAYFNRTLDYLIDPLEDKIIKLIVSMSSLNDDECSEFSSETIAILKFRFKSLEKEYWDIPLDYDLLTPSGLIDLVKSANVSEPFLQDLLKILEEIVEENNKRRREIDISNIDFVHRLRRANDLQAKKKKEEEEESYYIDPEVAEMANELHKNPEMRILFDASKKLTKDDLRFVTEMVNRIRKEENKD